MGVERGGGRRVGGRYNGGFGTGPPPLLPPKETHRYRIALPGLTGQNSPTIGGKGGKGGRGKGGGGGIFGPEPRDCVVEGATRDGPARERASRADPIN